MTSAELATASREELRTLPIVADTLNEAEQQLIAYRELLERQERTALKLRTPCGGVYRPGTAGVGGAGCGAGCPFYPFLTSATHPAARGTNPGWPGSSTDVSVCCENRLEPVVTRS
jgi:hypothetical protein